ncbi:preQ(0) biosynthesis protein QueD [Thermodesulfobium acidiphilum]|uniref:6-carboxy-5,6,7,8-tetrahydropterin synthase n=1 Tax=Thermodesulfobium acidiphilum TaxID=1794699 RepID=A0A2R4W0J2_THEAF|nr:6-carboxytetrahydropterin synthase QueD [Thermodesulfobium acidiphilum]AWB10234.1 preQ(0) biosynthesis protein QueD [Thermodesulfobium acidiphilum]
MYTLIVEDSFSSAHFLTNNGEIEFEPLHGHTFKVSVEISGNTLDDFGMLIDFRIIKKKLKEILDIFDHKLLNDVVKFSPTSENLSKYIFDEFEKFLENYKGIIVSSVTVWESQTTCAKYKKEVSR